MASAPNSAHSRLTDPNYTNWLKADQGLIHLRDVLSVPTERVMRAFYAALPKGPGCSMSCIAVNIKKRGMQPSCGACDPCLHVMRQAHNATHKTPPGPIFWKNSNPANWHSDYWEVAKCYLGPGQSEGSCPETTDCSNILTLWLNCAAFSPLVSNPQLLEYVREKRNELFHSATMKFSDAEVRSHFDTMLDLLKDALLQAQPDVDPRGVADLEAIRDRPSVILTDGEYQVWEHLMRSCQHNLHEIKDLKRFLSANHDLLEQLKQIGRHIDTGTNYTVGKLLAIGGCSRVYSCAEDVKLVIKKVELAPNPSRKRMEHFNLILHEVEMFKQLDHPRIVRYSGSDAKDTEVCIVLENMPRGSLSHYLEEHGAFDEDLCRKYTIQILQGLTYLHENKIIHRDLKGANILLDESGDIKICDFGLAKLMECSISANGGSKSSVGTAHWMAPEVVKGERYGRKCDIWSMGCTLVEMLTAKPPWPDIEEVQVMFKIAKGSQPESTLPEGLSEAARDFLDLCFKTDPRERPSAVDLMQHRFIIGTLRQDTGTLREEMDTQKITVGTLRQEMDTAEAAMDALPTKMGMVPQAKPQEYGIERLRAELAENYLAHYSQLRPVPWADITLPINLMYQEQSIKGRKDAWRKDGRLLELKSIFEPSVKLGPRPERLLVEGAPGMGKSTLCQRLVGSWARGVQASHRKPASEPYAACLDELEGSYLNEYLLVFFLRVRELYEVTLTDNLLANLVQDLCGQDKAKFVRCIWKNISRVLLLIDGYDEGDEEQKKYVDGWLTDRECRGCTIIVTSRPGFCCPNPPPHTTYMLEGLDKIKQQNYAQRFDELMGGEPGEKSAAEQLKELPFQHLDFLQNPLMLALVCVLARQGQSVLPHNVTGLYNIFVQFMSDKAMRDPINFSDEYVSKLQILLQKTAFDLFCSKKKEITSDILSKHVATSEIKKTMIALCKFGLVCQEIKLERLRNNQKGTFLHQSFLDYFAACHFVSLSKEERSALLENIEIQDNMLVFVAGLGGENEEHRECFNQMMEAWKRTVKRECKEGIRNHYVLHACFLWAGELQDPAWFADNIINISQTLQGIYLEQSCTTSCMQGAIALFHCTYRQIQSLSSNKPLSVVLCNCRNIDTSAQLDLLHLAQSAKIKLICNYLRLPDCLTHDQCERLRTVLPQLTQLQELVITVSSLTSLNTVSRGFNSTSLLRFLNVTCSSSSPRDSSSATAEPWSPSDELLANINRLTKLWKINLRDEESTLLIENRREIMQRLTKKLHPRVWVEIWDKNLEIGLLTRWSDSV